MKQQGLSYVEVLVALLLMSTMILALFQASWKNQQLCNQILLQQGALSILDKASEYLLAGLPAINTVAPPYQLQIKPGNKGSDLVVVWPKVNMDSSAGFARLVRHISK